MPAWVCSRLKKNLNIRRGTAFRTFQDAIKWLDCERIFDHWGSSKSYDGTTTFCSELYVGVDAADVAMIIRFADAIDASWLIDANAYWAPGRVVRIEWSPKTPTMHDQCKP